MLIFKKTDKKPNIVEINRGIEIEKKGAIIRATLLTPELLQVHYLDPVSTEMQASLIDELTQYAIDKGAVDSIRVFPHHMMQSLSI